MPLLLIALDSWFKYNNPEVKGISHKFNRWVLLQDWDISDPTKCIPKEIQHFEFVGASKGWEDSARASCCLVGFIAKEMEPESTNKW